MEQVRTASGTWHMGHTRLIPELLMLEQARTASGTWDTGYTRLIPELLMLEQIGTASGMWHTGHTEPTVDIRVAGCWNRSGQLLACGTRGTLSQLWISELLDAGTSQDSFWHVAHGTHKVDTGVADAGTDRDSFWGVAQGAH